MLCFVTALLWTLFVPLQTDYESPKGHAGFSHFLYELCLVQPYVICQSLSAHAPWSDVEGTAEHISSLLRFSLWRLTCRAGQGACAGFHKGFTVELGIWTLYSTHSQDFALRWADPSHSFLSVSPSSLEMRHTCTWRSKDKAVVEETAGKGQKDWVPKIIWALSFEKGK